MRSIFSDFGWYIVILPCNRVVAGPQVSSAWFISSIVTLQLLMSYFLIIYLNLAVLGHPIIFCTFLAVFTPSISLMLK